MSSTCQRDVDQCRSSSTNCQLNVCKFPDGQFTRRRLMPTSLAASIQIGKAGHTPSNRAAAPCVCVRVCCRRELRSSCGMGPGDAFRVYLGRRTLAWHAIVFRAPHMQKTGNTSGDCCTSAELSGPVDHLLIVVSGPLPQQERMLGTGAVAGSAFRLDVSPAAGMVGTCRLPPTVTRRPPACRPPDPTPIRQRGRFPLDYLRPAGHAAACD